MKSLSLKQEMDLCYSEINSRIIFRIPNVTNSGKINLYISMIKPLLDGSDIYNNLFKDNNDFYEFVYYILRYNFSQKVFKKLPGMYRNFLINELYNVREYANKYNVSEKILLKLAKILIRGKFSIFSLIRLYKAGNSLRMIKFINKIKSNILIDFDGNYSKYSHKELNVLIKVLQVIRTNITPKTLKKFDYMIPELLNNSSISNIYCSILNMEYNRDYLSERLISRLERKLYFLNRFHRIPKNKAIYDIPMNILMQINNKQFGKFIKEFKLLENKPIGNTGLVANGLCFMHSVGRNKFIGNNALSLFPNMVETAYKNKSVIADLYSKTKSYITIWSESDFMKKVNISGILLKNNIKIPERLEVIDLKGVEAGIKWVNESNSKIKSEIFAELLKFYDYNILSVIKNIITAEEKGLDLSNLKDKVIPDILINNGKYTLRMLGNKDPRGLTLGKYTNCCQHINGAGATCAIYGYTKSFSGFYVLERENKIVAQSWVWVYNGNFIIDSIEALDYHYGNVMLGMLLDNLSIFDKYKSVILGLNSAKFNKDKIKDYDHIRPHINVTIYGKNLYTDTSNSAVLRGYYEG